MLGHILVQIIDIYIKIVILDVLMSWVIMALPNVRFLYSVQRILDKLVEPAMFPIRRAVRPYTRDLPIDFSPLILILVLQIVVQPLIIRIFGG